MVSAVGIENYLINLIYIQMYIQMSGVMLSISTVVFAYPASMSPFFR